MKDLVFAEDWRDYLVALAMEAYDRTHPNHRLVAHPQRTSFEAEARERMSQASQCMAIDFDLPTRHAEPAFLPSPESKL